MKYEFNNREWLIKKFEEIKKRTFKAIEQLSEEQLNWAPDHVSHNIPTLLRHIEGNINERIRAGICNEEIVRNRDKEFLKTFMTKNEAETLINSNMEFIITLIMDLPEEKFEEVQLVRGKKRKNIEMLHQCTTHFSEHMGQILYITKQCLKESYKSTSL